MVCKSCYHIVEEEFKDFLIKMENPWADDNIKQKTKVFMKRISLSRSSETQNQYRPKGVKNAFGKKIEDKSWRGKRLCWHGKKELHREWDWSTKDENRLIFGKASKQ